MSVDESTCQTALEMHETWKGKVEVVSRVSLQGMDDLAVAYTPGVAEPCRAIAANRDESYRYTRRGNLVAVVTDGSAVLGLGNIGPEASMPVMEGKCALFKEFADIDAFPLCLRTNDVDEIVRTVSCIAGGFGGINLEDIAAPRCFEIERRLKEICDVPVFHDDQHGTAVVVCAALMNACRLTGRRLEDVRVVFSGAGAAGVSIAELLLAFGVRHITMTDIQGIVYAEREGLSEELRHLIEEIGLDQKPGTLADAVVDADVFIGVSAPRVLTREMVQTMAPESIVLALANPIPEIFPEEALAGGAAIAATGRSDYPNQINNVLAFPGIFKGALAVRASNINDSMLMAAPKAIAELIDSDELAYDNIVPSPFDERVVPAVARAVADCARACGLARID